MHDYLVEDVPADAEEQGQMEVTPAGEILAVEIGAPAR